LTSDKEREAHIPQKAVGKKRTALVKRNDILFYQYSSLNFLKHRNKPGSCASARGEWYDSKESNEGQHT
jgi:hypothetical protein